MMAEGNNEKEPKSEAAKADDDRVVAAISYIGIISVIIYLLYREKGNKFVLFHSLQGMLLFGTVILADICLMITILGILLIPFVFLGYLAAVIFLAFKAYKNERYQLPVLGDIAAKHT
jgi:uncharacterized membrane protein